MGRGRTEVAFSIYAPRALHDVVRARLRVVVSEMSAGHPRHGSRGCGQSGGTSGIVVGVCQHIACRCSGGGGGDGRYTTLPLILDPRVRRFLREQTEEGAAYAESAAVHARS